MSILIFFAVLFVLVLVHEWGHYITAKKTGMRVDEFAIGFPPRLFSIKKGETEYSFNALPIGGYVRIFGENPEAVDPNDTDKERAFGSRPKWAQAIVLVAGVTMNILFAWLLFFATYLIGVPTSIDESAVSPNSALYVSAILPESPLNNQMPIGVEVLELSADGKTVTDLTPSSFSAFVQSVPGKDLSIKYRQGDTESSVVVVPEAGLLSADPDKVAVGVSLALVEIKQLGVGEALIASAKSTYNGFVAITVGLGTLLVESVKGTADFSQVAGPIGIVGMVGDAATYGLTALLTFTAMISLNLAVINLLPIPALDGGRLLFVFIEAVTKRNIDPVWMGRVNLIGFALLMLLMIVVTWNDIAKLL
jgi:regulator of sigma E protease